MKTEKNPSKRLTEKGFLIGQAAVRTMSIATTLIAIVLMTTSKQHMQLFGFQIAASYSYSPAFKFCVVANSVACFVSVTSLCVFLYYVRLPHPSQKIYFFMFLLDLMVMLCVVSGSSAATAIGYLGQYGNSHAVLTVWTTLKSIKLHFSISETENKIRNGFVSAI
ncbi:Casp-like protein 1f1 [Thalictrum thalictroides]|uniref:CASP-like protein n=1 Tax=Thalictrum thalictroides TaxID=46969 RepID=A0A7J6WS49_THATH|nr:Casp-like protein 1f1 [Thalictrum thalictroides]